MKLGFRDLRADEIEIRVAMCRANGLSLLLYKDARCDQNILDETVGAMNWKKSYQLIDGQLFCTIEIWDEEKGQWVGKMDVGTEAYTEAEKSRASDAQKRSAVAWGIGRELYSAPFIWIPAEKCNIKAKGNSYSCNDKFIVEQIIIENKKIVALSIRNKTTRQRVFCEDNRKRDKVA